METDLNIDGKILIPPFSSEYICPNCGFLDNGLYCSSCGKPVTIKINEIESQLTRRFNKLGFLSFENWKTKFPKIFEKYSFKLWDELNDKIVCKCSEGANGLKMQFLIVGSEKEVSEDQLLENLKEFTNSIQTTIESDNNKLRKSRSKNLTDYLEKLSIFYLKVDDKIEETKFEGKRTIITKSGTMGFTFLNTLGSYGASQAPKFKLKIEWTKRIINTLSLKVHPETRSLYDIVEHQTKIILKQTNIDTNQIAPKKKNILFQILHSISEGFVEYFLTFFQYIKNPSFFSELIASKKFISPGKIINLYLIGLACSITIPSLLSGGYINASKLTFFSDLPPFIAEVSELLVEFCLMLLVASCIHLLAIIKGKRGSFISMFLGLIFMKAFLQLFERPYNYITDEPLLNFLGGDVQAYNNIVYKLLSPLIFLIYAYFLFPLATAVYKVSRTLTIMGWSIAYVIIFVLASIASEDIIISDTYLSKQRFAGLMEDEQRAIEVYKTSVTPFLELGDKTGDYSKAIEGLDKSEIMFEPIVAKCSEINQELKNLYPNKSELIVYADAQCEYFNTRLQLFYAIENWLKNKGTQEEVLEKKKFFQDKMQELNKLNGLE